MQIYENWTAIQKKGEGLKNHNLKYVIQEHFDSVTVEEDSMHNGSF